MKKISIISGIYNPPEYLLKRFLDSCVNSTIDDCEFILIFDDPTDIKSRNIVKQYEDQFTKNELIIIENPKNIGIVPTYNLGMKYANGKYLAFLDSDDFFDNDYLEVMYEYANTNDLDILSGYSLTHFYNENENSSLDYMVSLNDDIWVNLFKRDVMIDNFIPYSDDPNVVFNSIKRIIVPKMDRLPLEKSTFYHYVRHYNNISQYSSKEMKKRMHDRVVMMKNDLVSIEHEFNQLLDQDSQ